MGDKKGEKKDILKLLDESIMSIERRQGYLKAKLAFETDEKIKTEIEEEMLLLDQQLGYTIDTKKTVEKELKKAKNEEQKKKIENLLKASYFIGVVRENTRMALDYDVRLDKDRELVYNSQFEKAVEKIFSSENFRFITKDMVDQIATDEEFMDMWENDPNKLEAMNIQLHSIYEHEMDRVLSVYGGDRTLSFEEKEAKFAEIIEEKNGFLTAPDILDKILKSDKAKSLEPEDRKFLEEIRDESLEIGREVKKIYDEFSKRDSSFEKGNGFSKYLYEREKKLLEKWTSYINGAYLDKTLKKDAEKTADADDYGEIFKMSKEFEFPIELQMKRDSVLAQVNDLRTRMEMWKVYERLPKGSPVSAKQKKKVMDDEYKSWVKIESIKRVGALTGGLERTISEWAAEGAITALKTAKDFRDAQLDREAQKNMNAHNNMDKELSEKEKKAIKEGLAAMVLREIIEIEKKRPESEDKSHYKELVEYKRSSGGKANYELSERDKFKSMARQLASDPAFTEMFDKYMSSNRFKKKDFASKSIKFIAEDLDKSFAKKLMKEPILEKTKKGIERKEAQKIKEAQEAKEAVKESKNELKKERNKK